MSLPDLLAFVPGLVLAFAAARSFPAGTRPVARAALALGVLALWAAVIAVWLDQAADPWNAARLTPAVALLHDVALYQPLDSGPVLSTVVGPFAFWLYLPIAGWSASPTALVLAASALNLLCFLGLALWLLRRADPLSRALGVATAAGLCVLSAPLRYSVFGIHADAPALLGLALGFGLLLDEKFPRPAMRFLAACALAAAVASKQSLLPLLALAPLLVAARHGKHAALSATLALAGAALLVLGGAALLCGPRELFDNMVRVPALHPWMEFDLASGEPHSHLHAASLLARLKVLLAAAFSLTALAAPLLALLLWAATLAWPEIRATRRVPAWLAWAALGLCLVPVSALGRVKLGGETNHFSLALLPLGIAALLWFCADSRRRPALAVLAALVVLLTVPHALLTRGWTAAWNNQNEQALRLVSENPGKFYFPWNPLSHLLAEGRVHHFDYGVFDRALGGAPLTRAHLEAGLPSPRPLIASYYAHHDHILREYFPDYIPTERPPGLSAGWRVYGPPETTPPATP